MAAVVDQTIDQESDEAAVDITEDDLKMAAVVDQTIDQEVVEAAKTLEENVPDLAIIDAMMMGDADIMPNERLMDPSDRHRAIVSYRLDELILQAAWNLDDEVTVGSGANRSIAIMETVDPALVHRMDLAIVLIDDTTTNELFGAAPDENKNKESDVGLTASEKGVIKLEDFHDTQHLVFDTGATTHSMKSKKGGTEIRGASGREVVAFDGRAMKIQCRFDMSRDVLDKNVNLVSTLNLTNVSYMPDSRFNLFSASQGIKQGWVGQIDVKSARLTREKVCLPSTGLFPQERACFMLFALSREELKRVVRLQLLPQQIVK